MDIYKVLQDQGEQLKSILSILTSHEPQQDKDSWLDLDGVIEYLPYPMSKPTMYEKLQAGKFPAEKRGKYWYSKTSWIDIFLETGKVVTTELKIKTIRDKMSA